MLTQIFDTLYISLADNNFLISSDDIWGFIGIGYYWFK